MEVSAQILRRTEQCLLERRKKTDEARRAWNEACREVDGLRGFAPDPAGDRKQKNVTGDPTQRAALRLEKARKAYAYWLEWLRIGEDLQRNFGDRLTQDVFTAAYDDGQSDADIAERTGKSRQAVRRIREKIATAAAFMAVQRGLMRV